MKTLNKQLKEILVIDDDIDILNFIQKILENAGYSVLHGSSVDDAIELIDRFAPHLILLDYKLQNHKGIELFKFLAQGQYSQTPVIMMSALDSKKLNEQCLALGAVDFLNKPLQPNLLLQRIKKYLKDYELPEITFKKDAPVISVHVPIECLKINEISMIIQSGIKIAAGLKLDIDSKFLKDTGLEGCQFFSVGESKVANPGIYNTEVLIKGLDEKTAKKIRQMRGV